MSFQPSGFKPPLHEQPQSSGEQSRDIIATRWQRVLDARRRTDESIAMNYPYKAVSPPEQPTAFQNVAPKPVLRLVPEIVQEQSPIVPAQAVEPAPMVSPAVASELSEQDLRIAAARQAEQAVRDEISEAA